MWTRRLYATFWFADLEQRDPIGRPNSVAAVQDTDCKAADWFNWLQEPGNKTAGYLSCGHFTKTLRGVELLKKDSAAYNIVHFACTYMYIANTILNTNLLHIIIMY
jgi:hypothetical protein